ncbi:uncharacterized protein J7T54_000015 [Emericellopsis cladophorae]|uniref:Uncharacterized protein n=1 Tax=Emericellopsis cladophorae TaxID=2686198 RepID=A0A9Q0BB18_9HYPO|nr:uncharacterized protein J7T54_000015 [Emericellopsis cladophorae]KAI6778206.1 hypothetical protein J7T54_000015 [Emericellopsis cladophorae]
MEAASRNRTEPISSSIEDSSIQPSGVCFDWLCLYVMDQNNNTAEGTLPPVARAYQHWLDKYALDMNQPEINECMFILRKLATTSDPPKANLGLHPIWKHYMTDKLGDVVWGVFYALRLLYVDNRSELRGSDNFEEGNRRIAENRLMQSPLARKIKQRYPNVNLRKAIWPGPAPPRPESWVISEHQSVSSQKTQKRKHQEVSESDDEHYGHPGYLVQSDIPSQEEVPARTRLLPKRKSGNRRVSYDPKEYFAGLDLGGDRDTSSTKAKKESSKSEGPPKLEAKSSQLTTLLSLRPPPTAQAKNQVTFTTNGTEDTLVPPDERIDSPQVAADQDAFQPAKESESTSQLSARIEYLEMENNTLRRRSDNLAKIANDALAREEKAIKANRKLYACMKPLRDQEPPAPAEVSEDDLASLVERMVAQQIENMGNR